VRTAPVALLLALAAPPVSLAHARTITPLEGMTRAVGRPPRRTAGSPGTLAHAIAAHAATRKWFRPVSEGTLPERFLEGACPPGMARIDDRFCIDRWEATLEIVDDAGARPWSPWLVPDPTKTYRAVSASGVVPQAYVSGEEAQKACSSAGKRLCRAVEWRFACGGSEGTTYPYGPTRAEGRCNDHGRSPMAFFYPQVKESWSLVSNHDMNDPRLDRMDGTVAKTGAHPGCVNDYGAFDMVGNLHEWTEDPNGTFQGGYFLDTSENGEGCAYRTTAHPFDYHDYSTGFRCCADLAATRVDDETP
jgi:hypothetical protein